MNRLESNYQSQEFSNEYQLVNGVQMNAENPDNFHVPPAVIKRHIGSSHFVELRIDSPRFSVHEADAEKCSCPSCNGEMTKPILRHEHPISLVSVPNHDVPSRGWGEDFWVRVTDRDERWISGVIDNRLVESRLHGLVYGNEIIFHEDHVLAVHNIHRQELVAQMDINDLKELAQWLGDLRRTEE